MQAQTHLLGITLSSKTILVGMCNALSVCSSPLRDLLCSKFLKKGDLAESIALWQGNSSFGLKNISDISQFNKH